MEKLTKAELDYLIKLMESDTSIDWNKAVVDLDANLHPDSLRKSFNVGRYCGYNVAKYVPYGPIREVTPYLTRRAQENTSVTGDMSRELNLLTKEMKRRGLL